MFNALTLLFILAFSQCGLPMTISEKMQYKETVKEMFFHAYNNYMEFAYPADELMPLTCKGRVRGREPSRGDIDECMGRFSLTLIDSLDTLAIIGAIDEFNEALKMVIRDVTFDADLIVSVFETNIRVLGGLLGAHFAVAALKERGYSQVKWYDNELVDMARIVGDKLLPAFNTSTGLPYARINLRHGVNSTTCGTTTCTACAGTLLMEFGALSYLTGNPEYELKAHRAMEALWSKRHLNYHLVGTVINVHNGEWTNRGTGVGAGIDSYYEYCLKSYILLGNREYLKRFATHYSAVKRYISNGPFLLDVYMNTPVKTSRNFMDSLLAFWPGLQVLWGDVSSAISVHNMLYEVMQKYNFIPEAFSTDNRFKPIWPQHPLRPEFIESTYFLYKATGDPYYLEVGKLVVDNLNKYSRVGCGFASIKNVQSNSQEDRMDSFFLAETLKYLYLLFSEDDDLPFNVDDYIFTTEAHIIPLSLSNPHKTSDVPLSDSLPHQCSAIKLPWMEVNIYHKMLSKQCSISRYAHPLSAENKKHTKFDDINFKLINFTDADHLMLLKEMGISYEFTNDNRIVLHHNPEKAVSPEAAQSGAKVIQEVITFSQAATETSKRAVKLVRILIPELKDHNEFIASPAQFGPELGGNAQFTVSSDIVVVKSPIDGCDVLSDDISGKIAIILRGGCTFIHKTRNAQRGGAIGVIIYDNGHTLNSPPFPFVMSGDGIQDVTIPALFLSHQDGLRLVNLTEEGPVRILMTWATTGDIQNHAHIFNNHKEKDQNSNSQGDDSNNQP